MGVFDKFKSQSIVMKASIVYVAAGFLQRGITLISGPIFTRLLSQEDYGVLMLFNTWYELIGIVAMLSLSAGVYNNGLLKYQEDRDIFTASLLALSNAATIFVAGVFFLFYDSLAWMIGLSENLLQLMFLCFFFSPALIFWTTRQRFEYQYKNSCAVTLSSTSIAVLISVFVTLYSDEAQRLLAKIWSEKMVLFLFWIVLYVYIFCKAKFKVRMNYWRYALRVNLPLIPHYLANFMLMGMDRIMISLFVGAGAAAIYSVAYSAAFLTQIFWQSVNAAILPLTYECIRNKTEGEVNDKVLPFLALYGAACIFISFLAPEIMAVLAPPSYQEGVYLIPILMVGVFLTGLYCLFANVEFYYESTMMIAVNSCFAAALNFGFNYLLLERYGYTVAAYTTTLCFFIQTLFHYMNYRRLGSSLYNMKAVVCIFLSVVFGCMFCLWVYDFLMIRYLILLLFIGGGWVKRDVLRQLYRGLKNKS